MAVLDVNDVRKLSADIGTKLDACDNGEGMECATLDSSLNKYAVACCNFYESARQWARDVFSGRLPFDSEVERAWLEEGRNLYMRSLSMWSRGRTAEIPCYELVGQGQLGFALSLFHQLLNDWVSPKLSVGPSARNPIAKSGENMGDIERRIAELPPLPKEWEPEDKAQRSVFRKIRP